MEEATNDVDTEHYDEVAEINTHLGVEEALLFRLVVVYATVDDENEHRNDLDDAQAPQDYAKLPN